MTEKDSPSETGMWSESHHKADNSKDHAVPLPNEWPGAFGIYRFSRDAVRQNVGTLVLLIIGLLVVSFIASFLLRTILGNFLGGIINEIVSVLVGSFFSICTIYVYLSGVDRRRIEFDKLVTIVPFSLFKKMVLLNLLIYALVCGGLILFIIPGIIIAMRLSLAPYFLVDQNLGIMESLNASLKITKGNLGKMWGLFGVGLLMALPIITIIGGLVSVYLLFMFSASTAILYLYLLQKPTKSQESTS